MICSSFVFFFAFWLYFYVTLHLRICPLFKRRGLNSYLVTVPSSFQNRGKSYLILFSENMSWIGSKRIRSGQSTWAIHDPKLTNITIYHQIRALFAVVDLIQTQINNSIGAKLFQLY